MPVCTTAQKPVLTLTIVMLVQSSPNRKKLQLGS